MNKSNLRKESCSESYEEILFKDILNLFGLKKYPKNGLFYNKLHEKTTFFDDLELIEVGCDGLYNSFEEWEFVEKEVSKKIGSFFGFITLLNIYSSSSYFSNINSYTQEYNLVNYAICSVFYLDGNNLDNNISQLLNHYNINQIEDIKNKNFKKERFGSGFNIVPEDLISGYKKIDVNNIEIKRGIDEYFRLYYLAATDSNLGNSFLKYWALSENIIKKIRNDNDNDNHDLPIEEMQNLVKNSKNDFFGVTRIEILKNKRNKLVHNFIDEIDESDRDLAKLISENAILFLIINFDVEKTKEFKDYKEILENLGT